MTSHRWLTCFSKVQSWCPVMLGSAFWKDRMAACHTLDLMTHRHVCTDQNTTCLTTREVSFWYTYGRIWPGFQFNPNSRSACGNSRRAFDVTCFVYVQDSSDHHHKLLPRKAFGEWGGSVKGPERQSSLHQPRCPKWWESSFSLSLCLCDHDSPPKSPV